MRAHWTLEADLAFLNHGSFGACPRVVLAEQQRLREAMEAEPVRFFVRELEPRLADVRVEVAAFLGADGDDLVFVRNATEGFNAVLRSLSFQPEDELLVTSHGYNAANNCVRYVAARAGARVVEARLPFPIAGPDAAVDAILDAVTPRTRLAVIDHVTSPTGIVLPIGRIVDELDRLGVDTLVDGAHGPGMERLELSELGAAYYTGNFHKWICAPKGAAFLHVRSDRQDAIVPTSISHGFNSPRERSAFLEQFDWIGTTDPTAVLCVPAALRFVADELGGWPALRERNRALLREGRDLLCDALGVEAPVPDAMLGFLAALPLPDGDAAAPTSALYLDALQLALFERHRVEVPVVPWPAPPKRLVRISAQAYNERADYERLARGLAAELGPCVGGGARRVRAPGDPG